MIVKQLIDEDFTNYKKPSMFIGFPSCTWKCEKDCGMRVCQNSTLATTKSVEIEVDKIVNRYLDNPITKAIVCGGLEPFDSITELAALIVEIRKYTNDDIIIYTGYTEDEILKGYSSRSNQNVKARADLYEFLIKQTKNIIIKFGRFVPNQQPHYDEVLGVKLASDNQYAKRIS